LGKAQDHERRSPSGIRQALVVGCAGTQGVEETRAKRFASFNARGHWTDARTQSGWGAPILLIAWSTIAVVIIDNFIKPVAMRHGTELPTLALFFGLAGGLDAFGPLGIFLGPAIIAVFAALLRVYRRTYVRDRVPEMDGH
jgi:AI-2E family transporter